MLSGEPQIPILPVGSRPSLSILNNICSPPPFPWPLNPGTDADQVRTGILKGEKVLRVTYILLRGESVFMSSFDSVDPGFVLELLHALTELKQSAA